MSAAVTDNFMEVAAEAEATTLAAPGKAIGATSINIASATGWPTATGIVVAIRVVDANGDEIPGTYTEWAATVSGTTLNFGGSPSPLIGSDQVYAAGATTQVYIPVSFASWNRLILALLQEHAQDGSHRLTSNSQWVNPPSNVARVTGEITAFGGSSAPSGWLLCNGAAVSRSAYAALFALIGTNYGSGDGSTTFNLPNFLGSVPVGLDGSQTEFNVLGKTGGEKTHTLTSTEMPSHTHSGWGSGSTGPGPTLAAVYQLGTGSPANQPVQATTATGGGAAHNNLQPYQVVNFIIKT